MNMKSVGQYILASTIAFSGVFSVAMNANAQSVDVNFTGTVPSACSVTKVSDGVLKLVGANDTLRSNQFDPAADRGAVKVTCVGSGMVTIGSLVPTSQNAINLGSTNSVNLLDEYNGNMGSNTTVYSNGMQKTFYIDATVNNNARPIPSGTYSYKTTVNVTPQ